MLIQIALTDLQRSDAKVRALLEAAEGHKSRDTAIHAILVRNIHDRQVRRLLIDAFRLIPEAPITLYDILKARMDRLAHEISGDPEVLSEVTAVFEQTVQQETFGASMRIEDIIAVNEELYAAVQDELADNSMDPSDRAYLNWDGLSALIVLAAERLWRDSFIKYRTEQEARHDWKSRKANEQEKGRRAHLTLLTRQAHSLMLLWLESSLYGLRAVSNSEAREGMPIDRPKTRSDVQKVVKRYLSTLNRWDKELHALIGTWHFRNQFGDGQRLRVLSAEFGPAKVDTREKGWAPVSPDAHDALRYEYFEVLRRESIHSRRPFAAAGYSILRITTGYGTRPTQFAVTALITIGLTALLFFFNDFFNPGISNASAHFCPEANVHITNWTNIIPTIIHYLYLATANLSSLGSDSRLASYCGGTGAQILLTLSAIAGYFLLAILASLFFQLLTEKE